MARILLIEDNVQARKAIEKFLLKKGHKTVACSNGQQGFDMLADNDFDLILTDLKLPHMSGIELLEKARNAGIHTPVILMTAHGSIESAVEAMKLGAEDFLSKPLQFSELEIRIERLLETSSLRSENARLRAEIAGQNGFGRIIGKSPAMMRAVKTLRLLSNDGNISVLIYGETGTGKELAAKALHYSGPRSQGPFVAINCGALPEQLLESELFGHEKGSFTDARSQKTGLFETADKGTLFLDEIDSLPLGVQVKLLRALEERSIRRVGGTADIALDIRLICASSRDLEALVELREFRADLYFRIAVASVNLPPLRKRNGDIPLLLDYFAGDKANSLDFSDEARKVLENYAWPGNVRELENLVELLKLTVKNRPVSISDLPDKILSVSDATPPGTGDYRGPDLKAATKSLTEDFETRFLRERLVRNRWNISKTAEEIGLSRAALHTKIKQYGLDKDV